MDNFYSLKYPRREYLDTTFRKVLGSKANQSDGAVTDYFNLPCFASILASFLPNTQIIKQFLQNSLS